MSLRSLYVFLASIFLLAACGGGAAPASGQATLLAMSTSSAPITFPGRRTDYSIYETEDGYAVVELNGSGARAGVPRDARLRFADISVGLDLDGNAGRAFRLYRAAFGRVPDAAGLGFWISQLDRGADPAAVAAAFMDSLEFKLRYGGGWADPQFIDELYRNVLRRAGDPAGQAYWIDLLQRGAVTRPQLLAAFGESAEGKAAVRQAIRNGIYFIEDGVPYLPAADAGANRIVDLGRPAGPDGSASTVAVGKSITYAWTFGKMPVGSTAVLEQATSARPWFVPDVQGDYELKLVVSDGIAYSPEATVIVTAVWWPDEGQLPATGNFVHFVSDAEVSSNRNSISSIYTQADAGITVYARASWLTVRVAGEQDWEADFGVPRSLEKLAPGYYGDLDTNTTAPLGGMWISGDASNCKAAGGWFVIDRVVYDGDTLAALDLRFEQHCADSQLVLRGHIYWSRDDQTHAPGPVSPPPAGLWRAAPGTTPIAGNFVYLESGAGDYIGAGRRYTYTEADASLQVSASSARASVRIVDSESIWTGAFVGMNWLARLAPGYYGNLRLPEHSNPTIGGMDWSGHGRACSEVSGWFVVDKVTYGADDTLTELDLRFEQLCNGSAAPLNGQVHWRAPGQ
jgi:hypothetical protein